MGYGSSPTNPNIGGVLRKSKKGAAARDRAGPRKNAAALVGKGGRTATNAVGRDSSEVAGNADRVDDFIRSLRSGSGVGDIVQSAWKRDGPDVGGVGRCVGRSGRGLFRHRPDVGEIADTEFRFNRQWVSMCFALKSGAATRNALFTDQLLGLRATRQPQVPVELIPFSLASNLSLLSVQDLHLVLSHVWARGQAGRECTTQFRASNSPCHTIGLGMF